MIYTLLIAYSRLTQPRWQNPGVHVPIVPWAGKKLNKQNTSRVQSCLNRNFFFFFIVIYVYRKLRTKEKHLCIKRCISNEGINICYDYNTMQIRENNNKILLINILSRLYWLSFIKARNRKTEYGVDWLNMTQIYSSLMTHCLIPFRVDTITENITAGRF